MKISAAFPPSPSIAEHVAVAEQLGYDTAWLYDSPALYTDVWVGLAQAAERTERIGLGTAVLVPALRHVSVTAAAIATVEAISPGRLTIAIGTGFTGARCLGERAMKWAEVSDYVTALRGLLKGEEVAYGGTYLTMLNPPGFGPARPIDVPILVAASGPKGFAVAKELGNGVFLAGTPNGADQFDRASMLMFGTVLRDGETAESAEVVERAGPAVAVMYHALYDAAPESLDNLPGGPEWRTDIEQVPEASRHLAIHDGHLVALTDRDRAAVGPMISMQTLTAEQVRERLAGLAAGGVTEIAYQPAASDVAGDLESFIAAANG